MIVLRIRELLTRASGSVEAPTTPGRVVHPIVTAPTHGRDRSEWMIGRPFVVRCELCSSFIFDKGDSTPQATLIVHWIIEHSAEYAAGHPESAEVLWGNNQ